MKEQKGITLVALVITIIVLLILAGVTIAALSGQNGILINASNSQKNTAMSEAKEAFTMAVNTILTNKAAGTTPSDLTLVNIKSEMTKNYGNIKSVKANNLTNPTYLIVDVNGTNVKLMITKPASGDEYTAWTAGATSIAGSTDTSVEITTGS